MFRKAAAAEDFPVEPVSDFSGCGTKDIMALLDAARAKNPPPPQTWLFDAQMELNRRLLSMMTHLVGDRG